MPGAPDWSGTRLLHGTTQVLNKVQNGLAPGGSDVWTVPVTRPGYILEIHLFNQTDNVTKLPVGIQLQWEDGMSGDNLETQAWIVTAGTAATPHYIDGSGPTGGGTLKITINNLSGTATLGYFLIIDETSFAYIRHDWRTDNVFGFSATGYTLPPAQDVNTDVLFAANGVNIGAGAHVSYILPLYNGPVYCRFGTTAGAAANMEIEADLSVYGGTIGANQAWDFFTDINGQVSQLATQPRIQCVLTATNHSAGALQLFGSLLIAER